ELEQRQHAAFEALRADIAHFLGDSDRRLSTLETQSDAEGTAGAGVALLKLAASLDARFAELENRGNAEFETVRRRIEDRIVQVGQKTVRAPEQLSESVATLSKRQLPGSASDEAQRAAG